MVISFDGACKGNGTPECMSVGACVTDDLTFSTRTETLESTNQRGELNGAISALTKASITDELVYIVTDSEFIFNSINKEWCLSWPIKNWLTSMGDPIKNQDQWSQIVDILQSIDIDRITMIYIKGHVLPYTKLQAAKDLSIAIKSDAGWDIDYTLKPNIEALYNAIETKFDEYYKNNAHKVIKCYDTTVRINGYDLDAKLFKKCVCLNMITDLIAGLKLDKVVNSSK